MVRVKPDERRRITLSKEVMEMADEFELIRVREEVVLIPIPRDPIKALQEEGKKIPAHLSIKDLKRMARKRALEDAIGDAKRVLRR